MRTGSVVRPASFSTAAKARGGFAAAHLVSRPIAFSQDQFVGVGRLLEHLNAHVVDHLDDVFDLIRFRDILGRWSLTSA